MLLLTVAACRPPLADDLPRPVGVGRTDDGRLRFVVPLCPGESLSSFLVQDQQSPRLLWKVSQPTGTEERAGVIVLGDARGFEKQDIPLQEPLPPILDVTARLTDDFPIANAFQLTDIPEDFAGTDQVLGLSGRKSSEEDFRSKTEDDYC
ncbi:MULTISPECIES: hypothetical protein [unclassified Microbispora]|uniref:hypothetical protein n=1 Tax=unclassified Microbispora TaxID=2614687 RepID=UPI00147452C7|nr:MULTISPECIES: hypothetical protein [unclassified Microbispora]